MIVVKVLMWPAGYEGAEYELGRLYAFNTAARTVHTNGKRGDYGVKVCRKGKFSKAQAFEAAARTGEVIDYPRQSYNVWRLVSRLVLACFPEERPRPAPPAPVGALLAELREHSTQSAILRQEPRISTATLGRIIEALEGS